MRSTPISLAPERSTYLDELWEVVNRRHYRTRVTAQPYWAVPLVSARDLWRMDQPGSVPAAGLIPDVEPPAIYLHPLLRDAPAPRYVLVYLLCHEALHQLIDVDPCHHDDPIHPPHFMARERLIPSRERARGWLQRHDFPVLPA